MRYVRVQISGPTADSPVTTLAATSGIERVQLLAGGVAETDTPTYTLSVRGSAGRIQDVFEANDDVVAWEIAGTEADLAYVYVQFEAPPQVGWLRDQLTRNSLVVLLPATFHADSVELTVVGTQADLSDTFEMLPAGIEATVLEIGTYEDRPHQGYSLTDRQRTVLKTAYEMGYYDQPRTTTHNPQGNRRPTRLCTEYCRRTSSKSRTAAGWRSFRVRWELTATLTPIPLCISEVHVFLSVGTNEQL